MNVRSGWRSGRLGPALPAVLLPYKPPSAEQGSRSPEGSNMQRPHLADWLHLNGELQNSRSPPPKLRESCPSSAAAATALVLLAP